MKKVIILASSFPVVFCGIFLFVTLIGAGAAAENSSSGGKGDGNVNPVTLADRKRADAVTPSAYQTEFIEKMKQYSDLSKSFGIYPSVMIAQASIESDWGRSELTKKAQNYFGVKASSEWIGPTIDMWTWEEVGGKKIKVIAKWKVFMTVEESVRDYCNFCHGKTYVDAGVLQATNYFEQITALKNGGYATDSAYIDLICTRIEEYNLDQFDV